jgi:hypothetical protein
MRYWYVRSLAILILVAELVVLLTYFSISLSKLPLSQLASVDSKLFDDNFISGLIYSDHTYKVLLSVFVVLQLLTCAAFVVVLNWEKAWGSIFMGLEFACLLSAFVSWFVLITIYIDEKGGLKSEHIAGAVVFMCACGFYFGAMIVKLFYTGKVQTWCEMVTFGVAVLLFVCSVVSGIVFMVSFYDKTVLYGWIYEHASFVLLIAAHLFLFVTDMLISVTDDRRAAYAQLPFREVRVDYAHLVLRGGEF